MRNPLAIACFFVALAIGVAHAEPQAPPPTLNPADVADVRCLAVGLVLIQSTDPQQHASGQGLTFYFLGRLDGRTPNFDLESVIYTTAHGMTESDIRAEAQRCGGIMVVRGQELVAMGQRVTQREQFDTTVQRP